MPTQEQERLAERAAERQRSTGQQVKANQLRALINRATTAEDLRRLQAQATTSLDIVQRRSRALAGATVQASGGYAIASAKQQKGLIINKLPEKQVSEQQADAAQARVKDLPRISQAPLQAQGGLSAEQADILADSAAAASKLANTVDAGSPAHARVQAQAAALQAKALQAQKQAAEKSAEAEPGVVAKAVQKSGEIVAEELLSESAAPAIALAIQTLAPLAGHLAPAVYAAANPAAQLITGGVKGLSQNVGIGLALNLVRNP